MKKTLITLSSMLLMALSLNAQTAVSETKTAKQYTPEKGDFAIGFDMVPVLRTIGSCFSSKIESEPIGGTPFTYDDMHATPNVSIIGKYMLTDRWGLKVNLGVMVNNYNEKAYVKDDLGMLINPLGEERVVDVRHITKNGTSLSFGAEYRVGKSRVQGVFGFGVLFGCSTYDVKYRYGNEITSINQHPTTVFTSTAGMNYAPTGYRVIEARTPGANFALGGYASAGVECFVAPKISLGLDVNLSLVGTMGYKGIVKSEGYNDAYQRIETFTQQVTPGNTGVNLSTDNIGGALSMNFYF